MSYIKLGQVSGRYDRAKILVILNSKYMRHVAQCHAIARTELAKMRPSDFVVTNSTPALAAQGYTEHEEDRHWHVLQLMGGQAQELIFEYDDRHLTPHPRIFPYKVALSKLAYFRNKAHGGGKTPLFTTAIFPMVDNDGILNYFCLVHGPLDNAKQRIIVGNDAARGMARLSKKLQRKHPGVKVRVHFVGDINKNKREQAEALWMKNHIEMPGDLVNVWDGYVPKKGGTHGRVHKDGTRSILDTVFTNAMVKKTGVLYDGINDSDHDSWYTLLNTAHIALRLLKRKGYKGPRR